jgi:hypothetical protein
MNMTIISKIPAMSKIERAQLRTNAERMLTAATEVRRTEARSVLEALSAQEEREFAALREHVAGQTVAQRVVNAFRKLPLTETERQLVQSLLDNPGATSQQLDIASGWEGGWHLHFGKMCGRREDLLWPAEPAVVRDGDFYCGILADFCTQTRGYKIKPEVAEGLAALGIYPKARELQP